MKKFFQITLIAVLLLAVLSGCQKQESAQPASLPENPGENITLSDSVQVREPSSLSVYSCPVEVLDSQLFVGTVLPEEGLTVKDLFSEGVLFISSPEDYLSVTINDFTLYRGFFLREHEGSYDQYDQVLSMLSLAGSVPEGQLRGYSYAPDEYLAEESQETADLAAQGTAFMEQLSMSVEDSPWRTEYLGQELYAQLRLNYEEYASSDFYRMFWRFQVEGIPVLAPYPQMTLSGGDASRQLLLPYLEMVLDEGEVQDVFGWNCLSGLTETDTAPLSLSQADALDAFAAFFPGLSQEQAIEITAMYPAYAALRQGQAITLQPVWAVEYTQSGQEYCLAVDFQSGTVI